MPMARPLLIKVTMVGRYDELIDAEAPDEFLFDLDRNTAMRAHPDLDDAILPRTLQKSADLGAGHAEALGQFLLCDLVRVVKRGDLGHHVEVRVPGVVWTRLRRGHATERGQEELVSGKRSKNV
jgi:hypothetical protein